MKKIYLKWLDSSGYDGWIGKNEFPEDLQEIETFAFLVSEHKDRIVVCSHISNHTMNCPMVIPKFAITEQRFIEDITEIVQVCNPRDGKYKRIDKTNGRIIDDTGSEDPYPNIPIK